MTEGNLQVIPQSSGGNTGGGAIVDLEFGSAADLRKKLDAMKQKLNLTKEFFREVMQEGVDYGIIPGTDKPTLYKAGAEGLCEFYNLAPTIASKVEDKSHDTGYYAVDVTVRLIHRGTGSIIAEGVGHANTFESRYRWRWVSEKDLPRGMDKEDLISKERNGRYGNYVQYRIENDDMHSIWNTVLKMAKKRALVDAVLSATRSSGIFAQTQEELDAYLQGYDPDGDPEGQPAAPPPKRQQSGNRGGNGSAGRSGNGARGGGGTQQKNRVLNLMKQQGLDWNGLAEAASAALGRQIGKVIQDIQTEADWKVVGDYLEDSGVQEDHDLDFDLPEGPV
ncbi:hypothetical protein DUZ99_02225 [Xylanibacillus composti]|uniref:Uncharacterized protein n=1 Tax=Xylanibacillus composti TaxID=1572762 RepID=A0A8J4M0F8_9BACL|nr:hypothetical protein [Xylanibacillus composti]MDT9723812.1 hypothetical protein [Xylanibacillus composti]GIQ67414.1 hypothetical protein XYCOK13_02380 [Xylanibacillus composti]